MSRKEIFHQCRVIDHQQLTPGIYVISLEMPLPQIPLPGTFVHIKVGNSNDPLFRRPFSIYDFDEKQGAIDILYKVFGRGTRLLSRVVAGDTLDVLGPLGNSFVAAEGEPDLILAGGGVGIPPLYLLARRINLARKRARIRFLCGLADAQERVMATRLESLPVELHFSTDNGTLGHHGLVTDLLGKEVDNAAGSDPLVCACGPEPMLKAVQDICRIHKVRCYLSLESIMPCGVGTCLGCVVKRADGNGYHRVCREGPVFSAAEVEL